MYHPRTFTNGRQPRHERFPGYIPERDEKTGQEIWPRGDEDTWKKGLLSAPPEDETSISNAIVHHMQTVRCYNLRNHSWH